ncbi:MAG: hypothetical protein QOI31_2558 [Solirubrobacterales bacterium]|jgi:hypothetical protein|nr:hypothetical protein [Solirubrobacterales bacterium]
MNGGVARFLGVGCLLVVILTGADQAAAAGAASPQLSTDGTTVVFMDDEALVKADRDENTDLYSSTLSSEPELISRGPEGDSQATDLFSLFVMSADASVVDFVTDEQLVAADNDAEDDIYQRAGGTTTLLSTGGNGAFPVTGIDISTSGSRSFFQTDESLDPLDTDSARDAYMNEAGVVTVLTTDGVYGTSDTDDVFMRGASDDGTEVFYYTTESLLPADADSGGDVYRRTVGGALELLSKGTGTGNAGTSSGVADFASDGSVATIESFEQLDPADTDTAQDIYTGDGGDAVLASSGGGANTDVHLTINSMSEDGLTVVFYTTESLLPADTDAVQDVYASINGTLTLISDRVQAGADTADAAIYDSTTPDGGSIFFRTAEQINAADTDSAFDLYAWRPGPTVIRVSSAGNGAFDVGPGAPSADDGSAVLFSTPEPLDVLDTDTTSDVYQRTVGATTLISGGVFGGNGAFDAFGYKAKISGDGVHRIFTTAEPMLPVDVNGIDDLYEFNGPGVDPTLLSLEHKPPTTTLTKTPEKKKKQNKEKKNEKFKFESDETGPSTYECQKDDGKPFKPCNSPYKEKYSAGKNDYKKHTFSVQATDVPGNVETPPESYTFKRKLK